MTKEKAVYKAYKQLHKDEHDFEGYEDFENYK